MEASIRSKLLLLITLVLLVGAITVPLSDTIRHSHAAPLSSWSVVPSPNVGQYNHLNDVAAISANDVWAVGNNSSTGTLIEHWDGASWSIVAKCFHTECAESLL